MRYLSLFSGVGGFDLGFDDAGMTCAGQVEIDPWASAVLAHRWPDVPRWADVNYTRGANERNSRNAEWWDWLPNGLDLICGGFPCQDISVAGLRAGLAGSRSGLWFQFRRIIAETRPRWVVIENVPGLLSSNGGRDMGTIVGQLAQLGYVGAYRVLDAQYYGVAQRRRRVFIVAYAGNGRAVGRTQSGEVGRRLAGVPVRVLFESESLPGHPAPGREAGMGVARSLTSSPGGSSGKEQQHTFVTTDGRPLNALGYPDPAYALADATGTRTGSGRERQDTFVFEPRFARNGRGAPDQIVPPLKAQSGQSGKGDGAPVLAFTGRGDTDGRRLDALTDGTHYALTDPGRGGRTQSRQILDGYTVRRLTPVECERLQGFPDDWTRWGRRDGRLVEISDSQRYRQMGNAVNRNVAKWLGRRILAVEEEL